ncbi:TIGR03862 family flavoprotein [Pseudooceanicola nitratireducens]|uniref:TIGR03862 family flavoprotein n=1 Tax=Pseudooceanicola nitratireducens TaxID=517719 RepID=UPI001C952377|nr:TIGR03862 family flavoprotein [Pseudooceanicola nitratireducens]MBY6157573.1 TIGR03862 family flavoprotein [Pseudooceanicola nitratireducens]
MAVGLVIGGGPAGLMAAEAMADAGVKVIVAEAKPSLGRKLLMAGKSGLNLTKDEPLPAFLDAYREAAPTLTPMLDAFGPDAAQAWAQGLGQELFTGTTVRVFPKVMKASPLLRAWQARLRDKGVDLRTRWRWTDWSSPESSPNSGSDSRTTLHFETPDGPQDITPDVTVLALGGASWPRLGSDGTWARHFDIAPFRPANVGLSIRWSDHMQAQFGQPLKSIALSAGDEVSRGECTITRRGLEGAGIYALSHILRDGTALHMDLVPDIPLDRLRAKLAKRRRGDSLASHLRRAIRLDPAKRALLMEFGRPLPDDIAPLLKALTIPHDGAMPMEQAISTAGGLRLSDLDEGLMLRTRPGTFAAGEMLDWEAPTGGYLLTACLATGLWAGRAAARYAQR